MAEAPATLVAFGAAGQVGRSLAECPVPAGWRLMAIDRRQADITRPEQVAAVLGAVERGGVVNLAAYTQVDRAESEPDAAFAINAGGARHVAEAAAARGLPVIHLSTDYVYDGSKTGPWIETDPTGPASVYGRSKLAGEEMVAAANARALVLRTAWVFGPFGNNFVKAILRRALAQPELGVVADQTGCPTPAPAIAATLWRLAERLVDSQDPADFGTFHYCGDEATSWCGFAEAILAEASRAGRTVGHVRAITTAEYPVPAKRPAYSVLDCTKIAGRHGIARPSWRAALHSDFARMIAGL